MIVGQLTDSLSSSSSSSENESPRQNARNSLKSNTSQTTLSANNCNNTNAHFFNAFKHIQNMYSDNKLCDVTLMCNNKQIRINAHRVILSSASDYFYAMFTNNLAESFKNEIEINEIVDGHALKSLVDFIYTGKIELNDSNVLSIVSASNFLQLNTVLRHGCDYLANSLNISNCLSIHRFSEQHLLQSLKTVSYRYLLDNFECIANNNELLNEFTEAELSDLFDNEYLNVTNEEFVFETLMKWICLNNSNDRKASLGRLLSKIRLPLLKAYFLTKQIENNKLLFNNSDCQSLLLEAAVFHINPAKFHHTQISRTIPRKSTVIIFIICILFFDCFKI